MFPSSFKAPKSESYGDNGTLGMNGEREYRGDQHGQQSDRIITWNGSQSRQPNRSILLQNFILDYVRRRLGLGRMCVGDEVMNHLLSVSIGGPISTIALQ